MLIFSFFVNFVFETAISETAVSKIIFKKTVKI